MIFTRKFIISVLLGLGGFWFSLYSLRFENPPFSITITWSYILPLLAGLAYGPLYGLIAGVIGLGAFFPFLIYPNNGWANLVNSLPLVLWYAWYGYFEMLRQRKASFWNHPFFVHLPFALIYVAFMRLFFPIAFSFNPPFWNPQAELSMPIPILEGVITKGILVMYMVVVADVCMLKTHFVRGLLNLPTRRESRYNGRIVLSAILSSFLLWYVFIVFNRIFIDRTFPGNLFLINEAHEIVAIVVFLTAGFFIGSIICQYAESRFKTEADLEKSRESYRQIFEQAADAIFIADALGNYCDVNESGCRLTGYTRAEFLHLNLRDVVMPDEQHNVPLQINKINAGDVVIFERRMRHKNGTPIDVEISARKLADGRLQGLVRDISQHKQTEEILKAQNELFTQFMNHSPIYVYIKEVTSIQSRVIQASENFIEMLGIPGSQMVGKNMYELFPAEFAARMTADDWSVVSDGNILRLDEELNGRSYTTIKFPIRYKDKTFLAGYTIDITAQKIAEKQFEATQIELRRLLDDAELSRRALLSLVEDQKEAEERIRQLNAELEQRVIERTVQLEVANKELEAFAYSVSHDLRAPLRALDGYSNVLLDDFGETLGEEGRHYLVRIQESSVRMGQLINNLLDLSRVTRAELSVQQVNLSKLAESISAELLKQSPGRKVNFEIAANLLVNGDANLLNIALENLLSNAFKFSSNCQQALIQIGVVQQAGEQVYFVRDNGVGFNMEYAHKLFAPFQRLHTAKEFPGTGIGLSIIQRIIARHGGRIWPTSAPGQGATFYFTLKA